MPTTRTSKRRLGALVASFAAVTLLASSCATLAPVSTDESSLSVPETTPELAAELAPPLSYRAAAPAEIAGCEIHPEDHFLNATNVDRAPRDPESASALAAVAGAPLRLPSSRIWDGVQSGMPINVVDSTATKKRDVIILSGSSRSYRGKYPISDDSKVQGHPGRAADAHLLTLDTADCTAYELIQYSQPLGRHIAWNGARYALDTTDMPPKTTNAPDTPMIGQYLMREEVRDEDIPHVLSWCSNRTSPEHVWPARRSDGTTPGGVPMGTWLRLKGDVDLAAFSGPARALADTLATRGVVLTDTCGHAFDIFHESADDWDAAGLQDLAQLTIDDFEVIDASDLMVAEDSFAVR